MHSILIPHRDRNEHLLLCLHSLYRAAQQCDPGEWEVVVVDSGSETPPQPCDGVSVVRDLQPPAMFNKCRALNLAIEAATGDVLTFLDADAVVGPLFLEGWRPLSDAALSRVCYRVRYIDADTLSRDLEGIFRTYNNQNDGKDLFSRGYEAYGRHKRLQPPVSEKHQPWGNSQFSIRRETLGDLRWDEAYISHGFEDQDFMAQLEAKLGGSYRAHIWTDGAHAMFHLNHEPGAWRDRNLSDFNHERYRVKRKGLLGY